MTTESVYKCDHCGRSEIRPPVPLAAGGTDAAARIAGWRIGATARKPRNVICPDCAGTDEDYWDRQTLNMAYAAGIDAGEQVWI